MNYNLSKSIKKQLNSKEVIEVLEEIFKNSGEILDKDDDKLTIEGFNNGLGGINYLSKATFNVKVKDSKTIINVDIEQKTTKIFWIFIIIGLLVALIGMLFPIFFYYYGKSSTIKEIERGLLSVKEELD